MILAASVTLSLVLHVAGGRFMISLTSMSSSSRSTEIQRQRRKNHEQCGDDDGPDAQTETQR
jgi:hypothetical protein